VASYVHRSFLSCFSVLPRFMERVDIMSRDIFSQKPMFGSQFHSFRLVNAYSIDSADRKVQSVPPESLFSDPGLLLLVAGDVNIHNLLSDPLRSFSSQEVSSSTPYFEVAALGGFVLLNSPGVYTRFPLSGKACPVVIDLAFANPLLLPFIRGWKSSLPSTGSDHVPITILLASPSPDLAPPRLRWALTDWEALSPIVENFRVSPPLPCPSPGVLDEWTTETHDRLTGPLEDQTPTSCPPPHSKPWRSPHLTILCPEYHKAARFARKLGTPDSRELANLSRSGYFKAIKVAKNKQ